jgi:hypothetical protein
MHSDNQALEPGLRVRVRSEKMPIDLDIVGYYCPNQDCPCRNATLYFLEADGNLKTKLFKIVIDYETWRLISTEIYRSDHDYALIIHEFMDALDEEMKSLICSGKKTASSDEHALRNDIDYTSLTMDSLVCYSEIYAVNPYEQWLLEIDEKQYIAVDYYCPSPKCNCQDVMLIFDKVENNRAIGPPAVRCRIKFDTEKRIIEERGFGISTQYAENIVEELMTLFAGSGIGLFKERYARIKEWGKDCLQMELRKQNATPTATALKVGRNSPCPCGSGQKYKRCCGR